MLNQSSSQTAFVCDLNALNAEQKKRHQAVREQMEASVQAIKELRDGFSFQYNADAATVQLIAEFINLEHLCCPFLEFGLEAEHERGPVWLRIAGPEGVKQFLRAELGFAGDFQKQTH